MPDPVTAARAAFLGLDLPPDRPVLLACSGGGDSTFLAWAWSRHADLLPPARVVVVDHAHRPDAAADARAAAERLAALGLPTEVVNWKLATQDVLGDEPAMEPCDHGHPGASSLVSWRETGAPRAGSRPAGAPPHPKRGPETPASEGVCRREPIQASVQPAHAASTPRMASSRPVAENELRERRHRALRAAALRHGASAVLTGHTADDQAETLLLRLARGTGLRGLAGIPERREYAPGVLLLRPLLGLRRAELRAALARAGVAWADDPSNADPDANARARLRVELLPALARVATGDPVRALLRLQAEAAAWREAVADLLATGADWRGLPSLLRREAVAVRLRAVGATVSPARLADLEGALLARGRAGIDADLELVLEAGDLTVVTRPGRAERPARTGGSDAPPRPGTAPRCRR